MDKPKIAGLVPWLPWPLCRWRRWTELVRAERLAALRIGVALVLLVDLCTTYGPYVLDFYGPDSLARVGDRDVFQNQIRGGQMRPGEESPVSFWYWSLWRGFGHPVNLGFALAAWAFLTAWIVCRLWDRRPSQADSVSWSWLMGGWLAATTLAVLGSWARIETLPQTVDPHQMPALFESLEALVAPLQFSAAVLAFLTACGILVLNSVYRSEASASRASWLKASGALTGVLVVIAGWQWLHEATELGQPLDLDWLLLPWETNRTALRLGILAAGITTLLLLLGCFTRLSALLTMVLMMSFDNLNHYVTDSGETVRYILLFYVLLTPCGAVWSVDSWRRGDADRRPVYVSPWPLRLMFLQLTLIYFITGLYKISGDTWYDGSSLYRVLATPSLTRLPYAQLPVTYPLLQMATRIVLIWELSFPLLVLFRWTRVPALMMGALFHLGIWATMEIGFFGPYMLCFYLPMLPWERLSRRQESR